MKKMEQKNLGSPDEIRSFPKGKVEVAKVADVTFGRFTLLPGWKWSESVKPITKTDSCQIPHTQYIITGKLHVRMDHGQELEFKAGDVAIIPPGHDAWVVGNEPVTAIDFTGGVGYAVNHKH
jgi:hypothetical protein